MGGSVLPVGCQCRRLLQDCSVGRCCLPFLICVVGDGDDYVELVMAVVLVKAVAGIRSFGDVVG